MIRTTTSRVGAVILLLVTAAAGPAVARDFLSVVANAPVVPVAPRTPGRNFVRLPTLEYTFEIYAQCSDSRSPESLSINVADTRKSLQARQIASDRPTEISLKVPAAQIAPLVVEDYCILPDQEDGEAIRQLQTLTIPAALSAQASLLCGGDEDEAMTYVSKTLDVSLVCQETADDEDSGAE